MSWSIASTGNVFFSSGTSTITLYNVQSEKINKDAGFIAIPMPTSDSNSQLVYDVMGTTRTITIEGICTYLNVGNTSANLYKYAMDLVGLRQPENGNTPITRETLVSGGQGDTGSHVSGTFNAGFTYTSDILQTTINVFVQSAEINWEVGSPNAFTYTITLLEADGTSSG